MISCAVGQRCAAVVALETSGLDLGDVEIAAWTEAGAVDTPESTLGLTLTECGSTGRYILGVVPNTPGIIVISVAAGEVSVFVDVQAAAALGQERTTFRYQVNDGTNPLAGALVRLYANGLLAFSATTDEDGYVSGWLPPGDYQLRVAADGFGASSQTVTLYSSDEVLPLLTTVFPAEPADGAAFVLRGFALNGVELSIDGGDYEAQGAISSDGLLIALDGLATGVHSVRARRAYGEGYLYSNQLPVVVG